MNSYLQTIKDAGIPIYSANAAAQYLGRSEDGIGETTSDGFYTDMIESLSGTRITETRSPYIRSTCKYLVCAIVEISQTMDDDTIDNIDVLLKMSEDRVKKQAIDKPEYFYIPEVEEKVDENGKVKRKKGSAKVLANKVYLEQIKGTGMKRKDAIAIFVKEGVSTIKGSSTYYAGCKKEHGA